MAKAKKEPKQTFETVEFVLMMKHNNKVFQLPFAINSQVFEEFPDVAQNHVLDCFMELIEFRNKK